VVVSAQALLDVEVITGPLRLTCVSNQASISTSVEELDAPVYCSGGWRSVVGGLADFSVDVSGFLDTSPAEAGALTPDAEQFARLGSTAQPLIVAPSQADGSVAYLGASTEGDLSIFGQIGELAPMSASWWGESRLARGRLLVGPTQRTAGGTSATQILGTIPAGRNLVAVIAATSVPATNTLTVTIQRDDNAGFTSPTTVLALGPITAAQASSIVIPGPITPDDRYRVVWTLTGTALASRFAAAVGIA
jgi:hypothetical protein